MELLRKIIEKELPEVIHYYNLRYILGYDKDNLWKHIFSWFQLYEISPMDAKILLDLDYKLVQEDYLNFIKIKRLSLILGFSEEIVKKQIIEGGLSKNDIDSLLFNYNIKNLPYLNKFILSN